MSTVKMTSIPAKIEIVTRGSWVNVANEHLHLDRYGYENARNQELDEAPGGGPVRIWDQFVPMNRVGVKVSVGTYYMGWIRVSPLPVRPPLAETRDRLLGVEVTHAGVSSTASGLVQTLLKASVDAISLWPVIGNVTLPLIEPATTLPGQFVQYSVTRFILGQTVATSSVETEQEASAFAQTFKVMFLGYV